MDYPYIAHNGKILPKNQAVIPIDNIEYSYGFGVYETIRVKRGIPYFIDDHLERLFYSASIIKLIHALSLDEIKITAEKLIQKNNVESCNIKILLIGGKDAQSTELFLLCLQPFFPPNKMYQDGVHLISYTYDRFLPQAKTLNMLPSYIAYKRARAANAYDALLIDSNGFVNEGTRTNFIGLMGKTLISAPEENILQGVMRKLVLQAAKANSYELVYQQFTVQDIFNFDGAFLTSTSSKLMPIKSIDDLAFKEIASSVHNLKTIVENYLSNSQGQMR